jgi:hypothetical protein
MRRRVRISPAISGAFLAAVILLDCGFPEAQTVGPEFRINTFTAGDQAVASIYSIRNG